MTPFEDGSIDAIIFDLDGTIIDSEIFNLPAINATMAELGEESIQLPESTFRGIRWSVIADHIRTIRPHLEDVELETSFHRHFQGLVDLRADAIPGVVQFIRTVSAVVPLAIGTSSPRESAQKALHRLKLTSMFSVVVGAEDYGPSKPAPDCFLLASKRLGISPERCLVFEDSPAGLAAAHAAGMHAVAITHGRSPEAAGRLDAQLTLENFTQWPGGYFDCLS